MASELQLIAITPEDTAAGALATSLAGAGDLLEHLEACWSRFLPDSDLSQLNLADGQPVEVDPTTIVLLLAMVDAWHSTERRFDPTTLRALIDAGYRSSIEDPRRVTLLPALDIRLDGLEHHDHIDDHPNLDDVLIDRAAGTVRLPPELAIDAGGIGKGLAADLTVEHLLRTGAVGAMVSIGGDISMGGQPPEGGWNIHIEHPRRHRDAHALVGTVGVGAGGVATSSTTSRRWQHGGAERHHVIDPWTGTPSATDLSSVTVVARSGWLAEAHATAAILAGSCDVIDYFDRHHLSGLAVAGDDRVLATDDLVDLRSERSIVSPGGPT